MAGGHDLLRDARELVVSGWTQRADARSADGTPVTACSDGAVSWSLLGALVAAYEPRAAEDEAAGLAALLCACACLAQVLDTDDLDTWNNAPDRSQTEVSDALHEALALPLPAGPVAPSRLN